MQPRRDRGVRCSRLVPRRHAHTISKISSRPRQTRGDGRPCRCAGHVTAKAAKHTKGNPHSSVERTRESTEDNEGNEDPRPLRSLSFLLCKTSEHNRLCPLNDPI